MISTKHEYLEGSDLEPRLYILLFSPLCRARFFELIVTVLPNRRFSSRKLMMTLHYLIFRLPLSIELSLLIEW